MTSRKSDCPQIMQDLALFLSEKGHECVQIIGTKNHQFEWCQQDVCLEKLKYDDMCSRTEKIENFAKELQAKGHKCIQWMESFPPQLIWCEKDQCLY